MSNSVNPFIHGRAVFPQDLIGRDREIRRLCGRLAASQSTAIIGMPHIGKTSLLKAIEDAEFRRGCVGEQLSRDFFNYMDVQTLRSVQTQREFWLRALVPLKAGMDAETKTTPPATVGLYEVAEKNDFGTSVLQQLFSGLSKAEARLILLLDEFDDFLTHPVLNSAEFYGGLRSLASLSPGFVLVLATRKELEQLNEVTQAINPHGSPYFNVFTELRLGALPKNALQRLFDKANGRFGRQDYQFISDVSGLHPYLAQIAAAMLWEAYEDGHAGAERYLVASRAIYQQSRKHFADCWKSWTNETRKAATIVGLNQIPQIISPHTFLLSAVSDSLADYAPELARLEANGMMESDQAGGWTIKQWAFIWWLADELRRNVRDETEFNTWLRSQELDGLFTKKEWQSIGGAIRNTLSKLSKGTLTLIEGFAKGFGEAAGKHLGG
jgi:hypothetical protein